MVFVAMLRTVQAVGMRRVMADLLREGRVMGGVMVGRDKFGNKYYQDDTAIFGAHRRVDYASKDFDSSQVPGEWHRWLHCMTDDVPDPEEPRKVWQMDHTENLTNTPAQYVPFSTVRPKIEAWKP